MEKGKESKETSIDYFGDNLDLARKTRDNVPSYC